jgi:tetratricopeptide (TPR) repeat protein
MKKITLIEDHHQALDIWRRLKFKNLPLVHLDSHIDFGFYQAKPIHQAFKEAKNLKDLKRQLERTLLYQRYKDDLEAQLNIGNYIYPAMRDRIVDRFFWVIPGKREKFKSNKNNLKRLIKSIKSKESYQDTKIKITDNKISTKLYGRNFQTGDIFSIQKIEKPLLLDIDVDFLVFDSIRNTSLTKEIGKRKPWIYPDRLAELIKDKFPQVTYTTISYSVNGGFTPIEYKFFGDEICLRLTKGSLSPVLERLLSLRNKAIDAYFKNELKSSQAKFKEALIILERSKDLDAAFKSHFFSHLYFWLFKINWELLSKKSAKEYYRKAIEKDLTYRTKDNNTGWLYLKKR